MSGRLKQGRNCEPHLKQDNHRSCRQTEAPLFEAAAAYAAADILRLHTPGHKAGAGVEPQVREVLGDAALQMDSSDEVWAPAFDNDVVPVRLRAEKLLAEAYGVSRSFFLVNGASQGIQAAFLAVKGYGARDIILPRGSHLSAMQGLVLSGLRPRFVSPRFLPEWGILVPPPPAEITHRIQGCAGAAGVLITRPDYFGLCLDLHEIVQAAHARSVPVVVDEAHGPHLGFHPVFPEPAAAAGADIVIQSPHKLLGALTGGAYLHWCSSLVSEATLVGAVSLLTSTSPSHLLLASLDAARRQVALSGRELLERTRQLAAWARSEIEQLGGYRCFGRTDADRLKLTLDPAKLLVDVSPLGISGHQAEQLLRRNHGVQVELSTGRSVLIFITIGDSEQSVLRLVNALKRLKEDPELQRLRQKSSSRPVSLPKSWPETELEMLPQEAFWAPNQAVRWEDSCGRVAAEWVIPYPPGIPLLIPGERISLEIIDYRRALSAAGADMRSIGGSAEYVRVVQC